jgi:hypothetical protein
LDYSQTGSAPEFARATFAMARAVFEEWLGATASILSLDAGG